MGRDFPGLPRFVHAQKETFFQKAWPAGRSPPSLFPEGCGRGLEAGRSRRALRRDPPAAFESRSGPSWGCDGAIMGAAVLPPTWQLYLKDHRISTFKNWPFLEDCSCTPERVSRPLLAPQCPPTDISVPASSDSTPGPTVY